MDGRQRSLRAVRLVRDHAEKREERALGEISGQVREATARVERLRRERSALCEAELQTQGGLLCGAEIRQQAAVKDGLRRCEVEAVEELQLLEERCRETMRSYQAAHANCRAIEKLQAQRQLADLAVLGGRERKSADELFLGRRVLLHQDLER